MKSGRTTVIRKEVTSIGVGLLEEAIEYESGKGCNPILCLDPVPLEPPYQTFDSELVISHASGTRRKGQEAIAIDADLQPLITFDLYPAPEDELTIDWISTMLRALSVLPGRKAFELFGENGQVWFRFAIPEAEVPGFETAVQGLFPAVRILKTEEPLPVRTPAAVNELVPVPPYHRSLTLLGTRGASPLGLVADVFLKLKEGQKGLFQVLFNAASIHHDWHYNVENLVEAEMRSMKLAQLGGLSSDFSYDQDLPPLLELTVREKVRVDVGFFAVVVRYAIWAPDKPSCDSFLQSMRVATGMLRFGNRAFRVLSHSDLEGSLGKKKVSRMVRERITHRPGVMLTSQELASLVHLPNDRNLLMFDGIQQRSGFEWHPFEGQNPDAGSVCVGTNSFAGVTQDVVVPMGLRVRQSLVGGVTGYGKSNYLKNQCLQDGENNVGFCLFDPHGDLCMEVLACLPEERMKDLVYISLAEPGLVPRWNPFRSDAPPGKLADDIARGFLDLARSTGARMEHNFRMLAYVVRHLGGTMDDFAEIVTRTPKGVMLAQQAREIITNPQARRFLTKELPAYTDSELMSVRNKLDKLLLDEHLSATFSQPENDIDPREWMDKGKVVLVNLSSGLVGADQAHFVGGLLISLIHRAALTRGEGPPESRRPFILYVDEFQNLQTNTLAGILSEGRKYGLGAVLAHQERGQLRSEIAHALGNCAVNIVFKPAPEDIGYYRRALHGRVKDSDFENLGIGQAIVAAGSHLATVDVPLCSYPILREPRKAAREYAEKHYTHTDQITTPSAPFESRRTRTYDSLEPERKHK
jgi:hypothetical protein